MHLYVRSQTEILADVRRRMRDPQAVRWTDPEIYGAMADAMLTWHDRVIIPHVYEIPSGWTSGTARYALPSYVRGLLDPQQKRFTSDWLQASFSTRTEDMWVDILNFEVMPDGDGGWVIQFPDYLDAGDGRIIYWTHNGPPPLALPTLDGAITSSATTATVETTESLPEVGYIKIGSEWLHYAGTAVSASSVTLSNLLRGLFGTTAASHSDGASVAWGVGADTMDLFQQLQHYIRAELHALFLTDAAETEQATHERMRLHYLDLSDRFWMTYQPARPPHLRFDRRGIGDVSPNGGYNYSIGWPFIGVAR